MRRHIAFLTLALATGCVAQAAVGQPVQIAVTGGLIQGRHSDDGTARIFEGIPFAAPPLGELRWSPPAPVMPWTGVRSATAPAPACLQNDYRWNHATYLFGSEDCLTLDVRAPLRRGDKLPVMVWIHGGSNRAGGAGGTVDSRITDQGVVLVSVQYRLGVFGFLAHRQLAAEQGGTSGNYGLMDQIAALRWVQGNIARFGGDPANVTVFGESAGSQDVSLLLAAPSARGLFHKAIMESGTPGFGMAFRPLEEAFRLGDQLDRLTESNGIAGLRQTSAHALLAADTQLHDPVLWNQDFLWLRTTVDGRVLPASPDALLRQAPRRPVIIGSNRVEFGPPAGSIDMAAYAERWQGSAAGSALAFYHREETEGADPRLGHVEARMETDFVFRCPANNLANHLAQLSWPVWRYEFDAPAANKPPSDGLTEHGAEIGYVMDRRPLGRVMLQDYWIRMARAGNPNGNGRPRWPRYSLQDQSYALLSPGGMAVRSHLRPQPCDLIGRL